MRCDNVDIQVFWTKLVRGIRDEVRELPENERRWIIPRLEAIGSLQKRMHACFVGADGEKACHACGGDCCRRGKNHFTLVNLLGFLMRGDSPPAPEFTATCPFLAKEGCVLDVSRRPFNCVTFLCETIEERLPGEVRRHFYDLEARLRAHYLEFDHRYAGSSLRGLLIRAERMGGGLFLARLTAK